MYTVHINATRQDTIAFFLERSQNRIFSIVRILRPRVYSDRYQGFRIYIAGPSINPGFQLILTLYLLNLYRITRTFHFIVESNEDQRGCF